MVVAGPGGFVRAAGSIQNLHAGRAVDNFADYKEPCFADRFFMFGFYGKEELKLLPAGQRMSVY